MQREGGGGQVAGCIVSGEVMPWLADIDVGAALGRTEREFSERDRDVLDLVRPALEAALSDAQARERLVRALATNHKPGSAVVLLDRYGEIEHSSPDAERWLGEHFGAAEHV